MSDGRSPLEVLNSPVGSFTSAPAVACRRPRRTFRLVFLLLLVVGLAGALWFITTGSLSERSSPAPSQAVVEPPTKASSVTQTADTAVSDVLMTAAGFVKADQLATVSAEVTGTLKKTYVERGDRVKKGDAIAALDTASLNSLLDYARGQLKVAHNNQRQAHERLPLAEARFHRISLLKDGEVVPAQDYEDAKSALTERRAEVRRYDLQAQLAAIDIRSREIDLERATIRAPFDGIIVSMDATIGEVVSPVSAAGSFARTGIATLVDTRNFYAEVLVPEKSLAKLKNGQIVRVSPDALPELAVKGRVSYISPLVDEQRAAVLVRIALQQVPVDYKHNMSVHVDFL